jgi:hypothetical protein
MTGRPWGRRNSAPALILALVATMAHEGASAQAVCSAPHSSPTLAQGGSIGTLPRGAGWAQVSLYAQRATKFFNHLGNRQAFLADSRFDTRSVFLTGAVGLVDGLEVWAQVPVHRLGVEATSGESTSSGFGDVRVALRAAPELFGLPGVPLAFRVGAKVPGSSFPVDATVLPLTEGQTDVEMSLESGTVLSALPLYVVGWIGYRWRGENQDAARQPGNERFAHLAIGGSAGRVAFEIAADGLWGAAPLAQGIRLPSERRRLIQLVPTVGLEAGPGQLEVTAQVPVSGRNLPTGVGWSTGYRTTWGIL